MIGESIKKYRDDLKLTQEQLAQRHRVISRRMGLPTNMTRIIVAATENDDRAVKLDEIPPYCEIFEVSLSKLLGGPSNKAPWKRALYPGQPMRPATYSVLEDPEKLVGFLLDRLEPQIAQAAERIVQERLQGIVEPMVREILASAFRA